MYSPVLYSVLRIREHVWFIVVGKPVHRGQLPRSGSPSRSQGLRGGGGVSCSSTSNASANHLGYAASTRAHTACLKAGKDSQRRWLRMRLRARSPMSDGAWLGRPGRCRLKCGATSSIVICEREGKEGRATVACENSWPRVRSTGPSLSDVWLRDVESPLGV
jgi:hypothetical protein